MHELSGPKQGSIGDVGVSLLNVITEDAYEGNARNVLKMPIASNNTLALLNVVVVLPFAMVRYFIALLLFVK
jgi:hypothetical protein